LTPPQKAGFMKGIKQTSFTYPFGEVVVYDNYLISVINEGETVTPEYNRELARLAESVYEGRCFGYITHRKHSYSVDPKTYIETSKIENLVAFAVVTNEPVTISNTEVEKLFLRKPVEVFDTIEQAVTWIESLIANI
jgi:vacuolar-type H+-ATPase subunit D/Vma8